MNRLTITIGVAVILGVIIGLSSAQAQDTWERLCIGRDAVACAGCVLRDGGAPAFCVPKGQTPRHVQGRWQTPRVAFMTTRIAKPDGRQETVDPAKRPGSAALGQIRLAAFVRGQGEGHEVTHGISVYKGSQRILHLPGGSRTAAKPPSRRTSFVIIPGRSFGPITRRTTLRGLRRIYGPRSVRVGMLQPPHADFVKQRGAVIFGGTPREVQVFFRERTNRIERVIVSHKGSVWRTNRGIRIGAGLAQLERIFGGPFKITSFGRDGGGSVAYTGAATRQLYIRLTYPENLSSSDEKRLSTGKGFSSDDPAARRARLRVSVIWWDIGR